MVDDLHSKAIQETERYLVTVPADQADRALQAIDLVQQAMIEDTVAADVTARTPRRPAHAALRTRVAALPHVNP